MIGGIQNIGRIQELRSRIFFTFGMLAVYRAGCAVATPGINRDVIRTFFDQSRDTVFGLMNIFSGGAMEQLSIFALGIMPYISASIIFQLLTVVIPALEEMKKEGDSGQKKINQWTRYATVGLAFFQSFLIAQALQGAQFGSGAVLDPGLAFTLTTMVTLTTGTIFLMWLGEQITERGIGNGISLIIFAGIIVSIPSGINKVWMLIQTDQLSILEVILFLAFALAIVAGVVTVERGQRRIPIQSAKRVVGRRVMQGGMTYFPLRVNTAGVIPPIFASSLLMFPLTIAQFTESDRVRTFIQDYLDPGALSYNLVYLGLIVFFAFFYTAIMIDPQDVAENIRRMGGNIPGIRPGRSTADYIDKVLSRLTLVGAIYVGLVCILPVIISSQVNQPFYFGGTALLIAVGVGLDTIAQIESHLVSRQYEGFVKGGRIRGRLGR